MINKQTCFIIIVSFVMAFSLLLPGFSIDNNEYLSQLEEQFFTTKYSNENSLDRISRLEETIFGQVFSKDSENVRLERIKAVLNVDSNHFDEEVVNSNNDNSLIDINSTRTANSANNQDQSSNNSSNYSDSYYNDVEVEDYPAVSYLETQVFNKTYKGEDVTKRLARLEGQVFKESREANSLSQRMDDLKIAIVGSVNMPVAPNNSGDNLAYQNNFNSNQANGSTYFQDPGFKPYVQPPEMNTFQQDPNMSINQMPPTSGYQDSQLSQESLAQVASRLENQILGQDYSNQPLNQRLDRLEMKVFNQTAVGNPPESRLERLVAVVAAENTSDPNDLKKINRIRKIQTGLSIGGLLFTVLQGLLF